MEQLKNDLNHLKSNIYNLNSKGLGFHPFHSYLHFIFLTISVFILVIGVTFQLKTQTQPIQAVASTKTVPTDSAWASGTISNTSVSSNTIQLSSGSISATGGTITTSGDYTT